MEKEGDWLGGRTERRRPFALSLAPGEPNKSKGSNNNNNNNDYAAEDPEEKAFGAAEWQHDGNQPDRARRNNITLDYIDRHIAMDGGAHGLDVCERCRR